MNTFLRANFDSYNKKARADIKSAIDSKNIDVESENFEVSRFAREYYELIGKGSNILIVPQQIKEYSVETGSEENKFKKIGDGKFFKVTDKETTDILNRYRDSRRIKNRVRKYFSESNIDENKDTKMFLDSTIEEKDDTKIPEKIKTKLQKKLYNYFTEMKDNDIPITATLIGEKLSETEFKEEKLTEKVRLKALILAINRYTNINLSPAINDIEDEEDISDGVIELAKDIETGIDEFRNNFIEAVDNKITDFVENPDRYIKLYSNDRFMDRIKALKLVMEEK
jgi:sulfur relay (sulfurtransferase) DsrC/TusE family protein